MQQNLWAAILMILLLSSCENSVLDPTTEVTGKVVDHVTNQPLQGATVSLSENDDVWMGGARVTAEQQTDAEGDFHLKFEWKESPYKIRVMKENYTYTHVEYNERFNLPPVVMDYQELASLKKKQSLVFDMEPVGSLIVNIRNSNPKSSSSKITIKFEKVNKGYPTIGPLTLTGTNLEGFYVGAYAIANRHASYTYTIEKDGNKQTVEDSILIKPVIPTVLDINY